MNSPELNSPEPPVPEPATRQHNDPEATIDGTPATPPTLEQPPALTQQPEQTPEPPKPTRRERFSTRIGSALTRRVVLRGVVKGTTLKHEPSIRGMSERKITRPNPVTGVPETVTVVEQTVLPSYLESLHVPTASTDKTPLLEVNDGKPEANLNNPLFKSMASGIAENNHKQAVGARYAADGLLRRASVEQPGIIARGVDKLLPHNLRREAQMQRTYTEISHATLGTIMDVPNTPPQIRQANNPEQQSEKTWEAELELRNIQAFRTHAMSEWTAMGGATEDAGNSYIRGGNMILVDAPAMAAYFDVNVEALQNQISNRGETVVPPEVLTKFNAILQYAANKTLAGGLTPELAAMNNSPTDDKSPMDRVRTALPLQDYAKQKLAESQRDDYLGQARLAYPGFADMLTRERLEAIDNDVKDLMADTVEKKRKRDGDDRLSETESRQLRAAARAKTIQEHAEDGTPKEVLAILEIARSKTMEAKKLADSNNDKMSNPAKGW